MSEEPGALIKVFRLDLAHEIISGEVQVRDTEITMLEDEIERRGLQERYVSALLAQKEESDWIQGQEWFLIRATPEQRARAFIAAVEGHTQ